MKTISKIIVAGAVVVVGLAVAYRAANQAPDPSLPADGQMTQILGEGGCASCHTASPALPFYATWPVASSMIQAHVDAG